MAEHSLDKVVVAGTGEGLIAEAAAFLGMECVGISERYGREISDVFPAYAVARLGEMEGADILRHYITSGVQRVTDTLRLRSGRK